MLKIFDFNLKKIDQAEYELEKNYQGVPVRIFAQEELIKKMDKEVFIQARNVGQLPGLVGPVCIMPDTHCGYGAPIGTVFAMDSEKGYVSPGAVGYDINCGVRLIRTNLTLEKIKPYIKKLIDKLYRSIPAGLGRGGLIKTSKEELRKVVEQGVPYIVKKGIGCPEDIDHIEENGWIKGAKFSAISKQAVNRGLSQLATLGAGNHYLEIQKVDRIINKKKGKEFGITQKNQIVIMVHCGSRGLGHQVCSDYLKKFKTNFHQFRFQLADTQLIGAPIKSDYGQEYLSAMAGAANFAFVNRQAITHRLRKVFKEVLDKDSRKDLEMDLVYDLAHNIAKYENHIIPGTGKEKKVLVHRKGATRSFPNKPVIIGGSMETGSYLLMGTKTAMIKTYGSTVHGSGRTMSRSKAKKLIRGKEVLEKMKSQGIYIKSASFSGLAEETGMAYKDISEVVSSVETVGLSTPVAYFKPIGNIKG